MFGGVGHFSMIRDDNVRAQGPFRSPITAVSFGSMFAMLFGATWFAGIRRRLTALGAALSLAILLWPTRAAR